MIFSGISNSKASNANSKIRKTTKQVPQPQQQTVLPSVNGGGHRPHLQSVRVATKSAAKPASKAPLAAERFRPSVTRKSAPSPTSPAHRALGVGKKRKSATPDPQLSSDNDSESDAPSTSSSIGPRKKVKSSVSSVASSLGPKRRLALSREEQRKGNLRYVHGTDLTSSSGTDALKFKAPWEDETFLTCELQYPSLNQRERFELKWPKNEADDYKPMEDIIETVKLVVRAYFPEDLAEKYLDEEHGFERRFNRAWLRKSAEEFVEILSEYNDVLAPLVEDGTIHRQLERKDSLRLDAAHQLDWIKRILEQTYARTVSPKVETLRAYKNGSDNVYGEMMPRFISKVLQQTGTNDEKVFVDLGSGVGNVVLQAALEAGCESWGIEMMQNPCKLAKLQAREFPARARLWGLNVGAVKLIQGDFTDNAEIGAVLKRADVVLVNNQAFTPALNDKLLHMFLDLKEGCQVVSLKPFGFLHEWDKVDARNEHSVCNLFVQRGFEYFSESVSWTNQSGTYYIATKDRSKLEEFAKGQTRSARRR